MYIEPLQIRGPEIIILLIVVVVLLFGATKIPELARSLGRATGEFKKGRVDAEKELEREGSDERQKLERAAKDLGINPTGLTDQQLKEQIQKHLLK